ncbi:GIY-YIG nuclease family protein [bacterium]|nr:GIY-YIG nuclease family protein [bacterium]
MVKPFQFFVYILKCNDNSFYVGLINSLELRFLQHSRW